MGMEFGCSDRSDMEKITNYASICLPFPEAPKPFELSSANSAVDDPVSLI